MKMKKRFCKTFAMALVIGAFAVSSGCGGQNGDSTSDEGMYISPAQEFEMDSIEMLSQKRADAVLDYCLNSAATTQEQKDRFGALAQARGYSFSDPVFDENGNVDMEASRRVAVKFYIQVD